MDAALGGMVGLIPVTIAAGVAMKVTEASFGAGGTADRVSRRGRQQRRAVRRNVASVRRGPAKRRVPRRQITGIGNFDNVLP